MGRQIGFHMLGHDCEAFFTAAGRVGPFVTILRDAPDAAVEPIASPWRERADLMLWDKALAPAATREYIPHSSRGPYYRFPYDAPALEFCPTGGEIDWDGRRAVCAGRLYAGYYQDNRALATWFDRLAGWLRRHFQAYRIGNSTWRVGPDAWTWHQNGGLLLPNVRPLVTPTWRQLLGITNSENLTRK